MLFISLGIAVVLFVIGFTIGRRTNVKCPHGIKHGNESTNVNGSYVKRCPQCQRNDEEYYKRITIEAAAFKEEQDKKANYQSKFEMLLEKANEIRYEAVVSTESDLLEISHKQFEEVIANLFRRMGYSTTQTPFANDGGKDIIAKKNDEIYFIECKHYVPHNNVGRPEIQKLVGAMMGSNVKNGIFVTTGHFTKTAKEYAKNCHVDLIDLEDLAELMKAFSVGNDKNEYEICCRECGDIVRFKVFNDCETKKCCNGHDVKNIFHNVDACEPICPKCGCKLTDTDYHFICTNKDCRYRMPRDEYYNLRMYNERQFYIM